MDSTFYKIIDINTEKVWGSKIVDNKKIGETIKFEINEDKSNNVVDNLNNNYNLYQLYTSPKRETIFGSKYANIDKFPFMIKFISSSQKLSVQVHPKEKMETWLFLKDNSKIMLGLKDDLNKDNISVDNILNNSNIVQMPKYGFAVVNPGTIHSIYEDNIVCEVQNNCDITYRYYDWDNNRKLTQEEFIDHASFNRYDINKNTWQDFREFDSPNFNMKRYSIKFQTDFPKVDYCQILIVIEGKGVLTANDEKINIDSEDTYLLTPNVDFSVMGDLDILLIY